MVQAAEQLEIEREGVATMLNDVCCVKEMDVSGLPRKRGLKLNMF